MAWEHGPNAGGSASLVVVLSESPGQVLILGTCVPGENTAGWYL